VSFVPGLPQLGAERVGHVDRAEGAYLVPPDELLGLYS
jgi:hypothetical protein